MSRVTRTRGKSARSSDARPCIEPLEERILLTTIGVGDSFAYRAGDPGDQCPGPFQGNVIRVEVRNPVTGVGLLELIRWDEATQDVADIPGRLNGVPVFGGIAGDPCGQIIGGSPYTEAREISGIAAQYDPILDQTDYYAVYNELVDPILGVYEAMLLSVDNVAGSATPIGACGFYVVSALAFDSTGVLWAIASVPWALPQPLSYLATIDPGTGALTEVAEIDPPPPEAEIEALTFDDQDLLYGVNITNNRLVTVKRPGGNPVDGVIMDVGYLTDISTGEIIEDMWGIEFDDAGTLYGVAGDILYEIDPADAWCLMIGYVGVKNIPSPDGQLAGLTFDILNPDFLWSIRNDPEGFDQLVRLQREPARPADPFTIYVAESDEYTEIHTSAVPPDPNNPPYGYDLDGLTLWDAAMTPVISVPVVDPDTGEYVIDPDTGLIEIQTVNAPDGSGGVLVGAIEIFPDASVTNLPHDPDEPIKFPYGYMAIWREYPYAPALASPLGVFPGGELIAGITVADPIDLSGMVETIGIEPWIGYGPITSLATDSAGRFFTVENENSHLISIDPATGVGTDVAALAPAYRDLQALEFDAADVLWGVAMDFANTLHLVTIDTAGADVGTVTEIGAITGATSIPTMAFDSAGVLYGVNADFDWLVTIDTTTAALGYVGTLMDVRTWETITRVSGIAFLPGDVLIGIAKGEMYNINAATGECVWIMRTGLRGRPGLSYDPTQPGYLWTFESLIGPGKLMRIDVSWLHNIVGSTGFDDVGAIAVDRTGAFFGVDNTTSSFLSINPATGAGTLLAPLSIAYTNIQTMAFDTNDILWAVGTSPLAEYRLITIGSDAWDYGIVIEESIINGSTNITAMSFDSSNTLYAVNADQDSLVTIDTLTGLVVEQDPPILLFDTWTFAFITGMTGLTFGPDGTLYGVVGDTIYTVNETTAGCTFFRKTGIDDIITLTIDKTDITYLWGIQGVPGPDNLVRIHLGEGDHKGELGFTLIGGTLAGRTMVPHSAEIFQLGFMYANMEIHGDMRTMYVRTYCGGVPAGPAIYVPENSTIDTEGTLGDIYVMETMYSSIYAGGLAGIPDPLTDRIDWNDHLLEPLLELEGRLLDVLPEGFASISRYYDWDLNLEDMDEAYLIRRDWCVTNETMDTSQYIQSESGEIILWGAVDLLFGDLDDYYALPLEAGQTVEIHGYYTHVTYEEDGFPLSPAYINLYDPNGLHMGTFAPETLEDQGVGSRGDTEKTLTFTAPAAGVYYLQLHYGGPLLYYPYTIFVHDAMPSTGGGMRTMVDYFPLFYGLAPENKDLYVANGNWGAVNAMGDAIGPYVNIERGTLVDFEAGGTVGFRIAAWIVARDNIGRVQAHTGEIFAPYFWLDPDTEDVLRGGIEAGADTGQTRNINATLQNIEAGTDIFAYLGSSGSIGRIHSGGSIVLGTSIEANTDAAGPPTSIDMIEVDGNWGAVGKGLLGLNHGVGGNVRYMHVDGVIMEDWGGWWGPLQPTVIQGDSAEFTDDGGGVMTINPGFRMVDTGQTYPGTDTPIRERVDTIVQYYIVEVDDAVGGVLARIETDGPMSMNAVPGHRVEIGEMIIDGTLEDDVVSIRGDNSQVDIYDLQAYTALDTFNNATSGDIVSGDIAGVRELKTGGSIGYTETSTGARIPGAYDRPVDADPVCFGWFENRLNGVHISGEVELVKAGGSLGDLYITDDGTTPGVVWDIVVNADGHTPEGEWDGVRGTVYAHNTGGQQVDARDARINAIAVGDGLADDGTATIAEAGIFSEGTVGKVEISRRYEYLNGYWMGLINGAIFADMGVEEVIGTNGARDTAIIAGTGGMLLGLGHGSFDPFQCWAGFAVSSGPVGTVSFSGPNAAIYDAEVFGTYVEAVKTSANSEGIWGSYISAVRAEPPHPSIGLVEAGGPGLRTTMIGATGGSIGSVRGVGAVADLIENFIESTDGLQEFDARHIYENELHIPRMVDRIHATGNIIANLVDVGGIRSMRSGIDILGNQFFVAGPVTSVKVGNEFRSELILQGPEVADLGRLEAEGPVGGTIVSAGEIGAIISKTSSITADITTTEKAPSGDVGLIDAGTTFTGNLKVTGNLGTLRTKGHVGLNPEDVPDLTPSVIDVDGDVGKILIESPGGHATSHLYSDLNVGEDIKSLEIQGCLYGDLTTAGNIESLTFEGDVGRSFNLPLPVTRGNVEVRGYINGLKMPVGASIVADLVTGSDLDNIVIVDGDIIGTVRSLYGDILGVEVVDGNIIGNIVADGSIGTIKVVNGTIGAPGAPVAITALNGGIEEIAVSYGEIFANIDAFAGPIGRIAIENGDIRPGTINAATSIGSIDVTNGDLETNVHAGTTIDEVNIDNGDLMGILDAETGIGRIRLTRNINGGVVRSGGAIGEVRAGNMTNATISSASGIGKVQAIGNVDNTNILAGYDVGADGLFNTADDNPLTIGGVPHSGSIDSVEIQGDLDNSVLVAGVDPVDGNFRTPDNLPAAGLSYVGKMDVAGTITNSVVLADTGFGKLSDNLVGVADTVDVPPPAAPAAPDRFQFNPGKSTAPDGLVIAYKGDGEGFYYPSTGDILLPNAGASATLKVTFPGVTKTLNIVSYDDHSFKSVSLGPHIVLGDVDLDGAVGKLSVYEIAPGSVMAYDGGVNKFDVKGGAAINAAITAGAIGSFKAKGAFEAGGVTADSVKSIAVAGDFGADLRTLIGGVEKIKVSDGDLAGDVVSRGPVKSVSVKSRSTGGAITGDIDVTNGDLGKLSTTDRLAGSIDVPAGSIQKVSVKGGNFGNTDMPDDLNAIRALTGIKSFSLKDGDFDGLLSTVGAIGKVAAKGGEMHGRIRARDGIKSVKVDTMMYAIVASGSDLGSVKVTGNMEDSYIFAGFDPGDDGYDAVDHNTDDGWLDPLSDFAASIPADEVRGGTIKKVTIGGDLIRSAVSAAVGPGKDQYVGNGDDKICGTGYLLRGSVKGIFDPGAAPDAISGFSAASDVNRVTIGGQPIAPAAERVDPVGPPRVTAVDLTDDRIIVAFDQPINMGTIKTAWKDFGDSTVRLLASHNCTFFDGDDYDITDQVRHSVSYDIEDMKLTVSLFTTWRSLNRGTNFLLVLDGSRITDFSGDLLDGEFGGEDIYFPSGDTYPGGDFTYRFHYGDHGDTAAEALDLTDPAQAAILIHNQASTWPGAIHIRGEIGDNPDLPIIRKRDDVDIFRVDAQPGDILYWEITDPWRHTVQVWTFDGGAYWEVGPNSLTGQGWYTSVPETFWISVCTIPFGIPDPSLGEPFYAGGVTFGSYELTVHLFNDHNSNFTFDDATQVPTRIDIENRIATPEDVNVLGEPVQIITAPDDVDIYELVMRDQLGNEIPIPEGTPISVTLLTRTVGSHTLSAQVRAALFNDDGDLIVSLYFPPQPPVGGTLEPVEYLDDPILFSYAPADDHYMVAVWGTAQVAIDAYMPYELAVEVGTAATVPVIPQNVYLNFDGGEADYLADYFGPGAPPYLVPLDAAGFGFYGPHDTDILVAEVVEKIEEMYSDYANINFTTQRPVFGDYSEVLINSQLAVATEMYDLLGIAEQVDPLNADHNDMCVVYGGEIAEIWHVDYGCDFDEIATAIANVGAHELGHLLGLNHQVDLSVTLPHLIMGYHPDVHRLAAFGRGPLTEFLVGYQLDDLLLRVIA